MPGEHRAGRGGQHDAGDLDRVEPAGQHRGRDQAGRGDQRHRRRALRDPQHHRDHVGRHDHRQPDRVQRVGQRVADPGRAQHAAEHPAGAGDQHDRRDRAQRGLEQLLHRVLVGAPAAAEHDHRDEHADQQRDAGRAEDAQELHPARVRVDHADLGERVQPGVAEDQQDGQREQQHHGAQPRRVGGLVVVDGAEQRRDRVHDPAADPGAPQVAGQPPDGQHDDQADQQHQAQVRVELVGRGDRAGMRRQEHVHDRERGRRRDAVEQHVAAAVDPAGDREDDRQHQHEAGVEEDREADQQRGQAQPEDGALLTEPVDQRLGEHLRPAGVLDQLAEHRAERDEQGDRAQRAAQAVGQDVDDRAQRDAGGQRGQQRDQDQGEEGVHPEPDDQHQDQCDRRRGYAEQRPRAQCLFPFVHVCPLRPFQPGAVSTCLIIVLTAGVVLSPAPPGPVRAATDRRPAPPAASR